MTPSCLEPIPVKANTKDVQCKHCHPQTIMCPAAGPHTPVWEHEGGRHHWLRDRVGLRRGWWVWADSKEHRLTSDTGPTSSVPQPTLPGFQGKL